MIRIATGLQDPRLKNILVRGRESTGRKDESVRRILSRVAKDGDTALFHLTKQFDGFVLNKKNLRLSSEEINEQARQCPPQLTAAIDTAIANIKRFHSKQRLKSYTVKQGGFTLGQRVSPLDSVGIYIPGGKAPLFSTILMTAIPARLAGVKRIAAATPPSTAGLHPAMAYAFLKLKVTEIYRVGGAQAIAALAMGTETIPSVDKIVGPGNIYVSLAKKLLVGRVGIDMVAGPTEVVVVADSSANPAWIAVDLLAQAEHGTGDESAILLTTSAEVAWRVKSEIEERVAFAPKSERLKRTLNRGGLIIVLKNLAECIDLVNQIAPEHLELAIKNPRAAMDKVKHAGAIFLGHHACESLGDYLAGPNHVLPTLGTARFYSPLSVYDFLKRTSIIDCGPQALRQAGKKVIAMAEAEDLFFHGESVRVRQQK